MISENVQCLGQAERLLLRLNDAQYSSPAACFNAAVGTHMRHVTDHYEQFIAGVAGGVIDYDNRQRDAESETHRPVMIMLLRHLQDALQRSVAEDSLYRPVIISSASGTDAIRNREMPSTVIRELHFLHSHALHHFAQIAAQLRDQGIDIDQDFGVAPSTILHRADRSDCQGNA